MDFRVPIQIKGVKIGPDDIVVGDLDGVCIIPKLIERDVIKQALDKARGERMVQIKIQEGMGAKEAFETYGIL
jgi:regulator of RNase E activity RraA